jgi:Cu/Ag efflux protein CusF
MGRHIPLDEIMRNPVAPALVLALIAATAAHAQYGGAGGPGDGAGGGGHRHGRGNGQPPSGGSGGASRPTAAPSRPVVVSDSDIIGVVKAIDPASNRITIAYEPVLVRNWPAGTMPFVVARPELLTGASVGEKVRFKVDSQRIVELNPYVAVPPPP